MNERIKELAQQANGPNPFFGTLKNQVSLLGDDAVERFAELIVRECAEFTHPVTRKFIMEHFGVNE